MRGVRAALQYAKPLKMKRREGEQPGQSLPSRKAAHQKQRWIATHAGPLLPERARNADHIFRSRAVLVQGRSRTSMATTPSRGDTSPLGWSIETRARWTDQAILGELNERAWKDNLYSRCAPGQSARRWEIDCSQSVGWVGGKEWRGSGATAARGHASLASRSEPPPAFLGRNGKRTVYEDLM